MGVQSLTEGGEPNGALFLSIEVVLLVMLRAGLKNSKA